MSQKWFVGCDLGGTKVNAAIVDTDTGLTLGSVLEASLSREGPDAIVAQVTRLVKAAILASGIPPAQIRGMGVGVPAVLDPDKGAVEVIPNFAGAWIGYPLRDRLQSNSELPVHLLNDARCMTYGEWKFGAGRGVENLACLTLGTGVGGGLVLDGRLHLGAGARAGELGHQILEPHGLPCGCGSRGCLETLASGPAIAAMGMRAIRQGMASRLGELVNQDLNRVTAEVIARAAQEGDALALGLFAQAGFYLGIAIANVAASLAVSRVVVGGGVALAGEILFAPMRATFRERARTLPAEKIAIVPAGLGVMAGLIGAAGWAREKTQEGKA